MLKYYYTKDHLGSVHEVVAARGDLQGRYDYSPFGMRESLEGSFEAEFGFTGHHFHKKSGLVLTLYRAYDPNLGRWLSPDPINERGGLNLYGYVGNDVMNWTDDFGLDITEHKRPTHRFGGIADHYDVQIDTDIPTPNGKDSFKSVICSASDKGMATTPSTINDPLGKDSSYSETRRIKASRKEGNAVSSAMKNKYGGSKYGYSWPMNDCGETIDKAETALNDYRNMSRSDFNKKYGTAIK